MIGDNRLPELAAEIRKAHADARAAAAKSVQSAINAGERLIEAKRLVKHGQWLPWLKANCDISERSARVYMQLAKSQDRISKTADSADLTIQAALEVLAGPPRFVAGLRLMPDETAKLGVVGDAEFFLIERADDTHFWVSHVIGDQCQSFRRPVNIEHVGKVIATLDGRDGIFGIEWHDVPRNEWSSLLAA